MYKQPQKRWSKLKRDIENLFVPELDMKIYCLSYPIGSHGNAIPRFYIQVNHEIIWDFPKYYNTEPDSFHGWAWDMEFSQTLRDYINCKIEDLFIIKTNSEKYFFKYPFLVEAENDLIQILLASDRRLGKEKLIIFFTEKPNKYAQIILNKRFGIYEI